MKAILYVGHGTRSKKGADEAAAFLRKVISRADAPIQEISFLELTQPFIDEGFERCIEKGATAITVVPLFLLAAGHIKKDIPEELAPLMEKYPHVPVTMSEPFGIQPVLLDAIAEQVKSSAGNLIGHESILIVGRGSSDPDIHAAFSRIAEGLKKRLGVSCIRLCYLAATTPTFQEGMDSIIHEAKSRVIVIPYLLFKGLLLNEIEREVEKRKKHGIAILQTGCLTRHQAFEDLVVSRIGSEDGVYTAIGEA